MILKHLSQFSITSCLELFMYNSCLKFWKHKKTCRWPVTASAGWKTQFTSCSLKWSKFKFDHSAKNGWFSKDISRCLPWKSHFMTSKYPCFSIYLIVALYFVININFVHIKMSTASAWMEKLTFSLSNLHETISICIISKFRALIYLIQIQIS